MRRVLRLPLLSALVAALLTMPPAFAGPVVGEGIDGRDRIAVQLNQVALERHGPKVAIVEHLGAGASGRYRVLRDGQEVKAGELRPLPAFSEWGAGKSYFEVDFSDLEADGRYQVEAWIGLDRGSSPPARVLENAAFATTAKSVLAYFRASRSDDPRDRHIRIYGTQRYANVWGGWKDAGGDPGKYLSHLSFANYFNPQQAGLTVWALAKTYDASPGLYRAAGLEQAVLNEAFWGADFLHRLLDPSGYFYETIFDKWGTPGAERLVSGFEGIEGDYSTHYRAAFREGGGLSVAALARASLVAKRSGVHGEFSGVQYLADAERAFANLERNNTSYDYDGVENIIDDYAALMAAVELFHATGNETYRAAARMRAEKLSARLTPAGWFASDSGGRPYYHGVEAGFPILSLVYYLEIESDAARSARARQTIERALDHQLALDAAVANPYNYARQTFRLFRDKKLAPEILDGLFMPHRNETGYWWQGESARLASLATAAVLGGRVVAADPTGVFGIKRELARFAQNQLDWTLGRNPYRMCMLAGFGVRNPPWADSSGDIVAGGIANGITGADGNDEGRGIEFAPGPDEANWRWLEQWLPHSTWFLLASAAMAAPIR